MSEPLIDDLLDRWEANRAAGQVVPAEELCRDHPELLVQLSERIRAMEAVDGLLAGATGSAGPSTRTAPGGPTDLHLAAGQEPVPGYRLMGRLGRGGFGEVWSATGPGGFSVALKFVHLAGRAAKVELRSLEVMKDTRHANLLAMFGAWQKNDLLIIATELADRTLLDRFDEVRNRGLPGIPDPELLGYMAEAARGLDFLNQPRPGQDGGIQHRDVKPQNLLLVGGSVKVADFGLARVLSHTVTGHTGSMTPTYAAPEFFEGKTARQSDQYSLAVTYCHLRAGRLLFDGNAAQVMAGHLSRKPDLSMLPESERPAVARALSKSPADRWPSCGEFVETLRTAAAPAPMPSMTRRPRRTGWVLGAVALLVGAAAVMGWPLLHRKEAPSPGTDAAPNPVSDSLDGEKEGALTAPVLSCSKAAKEPFDRGHRLFLVQHNQAAIAAFNEAIEADPKCAAAFAYRGWAFGRLHQGEKAIADANRALQVAPSDDDELLAVAHYARGHGYRHSNQFDKAIADYSITIRLKSNWAPGYQNRALAYAAKGDRVHAQADRTRAKELGYGTPKK